MKNMIKMMAAVAVFATVGLFSNHAEASVKPMPKQNKLKISRKGPCTPFQLITVHVSVTPIGRTGYDLVCTDTEVITFHSDCTSTTAWRMDCIGVESPR
jgi:hypothetical protein